MPLTYHPKAGTIVICDYSTGFRAPEMVKRRPALIVSPRLRRREGLCTVVPLSTTAPYEVMPYHCELTPARAMPAPFDAPTFWAKADMLATVGFHRLDLPRLPRADGKRQYLAIVLSDEDLERVKACVRHALGLVP